MIKVNATSLKLPGLVILLAFLSVLISGCATIKLGPSYDQPLKEQVLDEGESADKVLIININGILSDSPKRGLLSQKPSVLDLVMMQLKKAEKDNRIRAVLLKINSPGGGVTVSDILYHELLAFKERTNKKLYVQMMDIAASGGVYIAMAADHIQAHPATITGSVGVISMSADLSETMQKIGAKVNIYKTGENKDMGSPFRAASESDKKAFQSLVDEMAERFYQIVQTTRKLSDEQMSALKTARVFTGQSAIQAGLVDSVGYLTDATEKACELAESKACTVVSYRFNENANATRYSPSMQLNDNVQAVKLLDIPLLEQMQLKSGIYYLYIP
ncbi:MAG: signal peptide peptidase SppA [Thiomicrorhabdus sp.]|nr:signal peptide peptidase SppA [Thiomicrorhabdus sp.]